MQRMQQLLEAQSCPSFSPTLTSKPRRGIVVQLYSKHTSTNAFQVRCIEDTDPNSKSLVTFYQSSRLCLSSSILFPSLSFPRLDSTMPRSGTREATHAGSWYEDDADVLSRQLDGWLEDVPNTIGDKELPIPKARVIIAPYVCSTRERRGRGGWGVLGGPANW